MPGMKLAISACYLFYADLIIAFKQKSYTVSEFTVELVML